MDTDCTEIATRVADELMAYYDGRAYLDEDGKTRVLEDNQEPGEDWSELDLSDWLSDALDYEFTVNSRRQFVSCRVYVALGGPNVFLDTMEQAIQCYWGGEQGRACIPLDAIAEIDGIVEEVANA